MGRVGDAELSLNYDRLGVAACLISGMSSVQIYFYAAPNGEALVSSFGGWGVSKVLKRGKQDKEQTLGKKVNTHHGPTQSMRPAWGNVTRKEEVAVFVATVGGWSFHQ